MGWTWRAVSRFTALLNRVLALALAAAVLHDLLVGTGPRWLDTAFAFVAAHREAAIAGAALLAVLNVHLIQFVLFSLANASGRAYIRSRAPGGTSRVALSAIRRALHATALAVPEIAKAKVDVARSGRNRYRVHVRYKVRDVHTAGAAAEHLRLVLKKRFAELVVLDPADRVEFDLDLAGIVDVGRRSRSQKRLPAPQDRLAPQPEEGGYQGGPVYPVEM